MRFGDRFLATGHSNATVCFPRRDARREGSSWRRVRGRTATAVPTTTTATRGSAAPWRRVTALPICRSPMSAAGGELPPPCQRRRRRGAMAPGYCHRRANDDGGSALPIAGFVAQAVSGGRTATAAPTTTTAARFPSAALPCPCPCPSLSLPFVSSSTPTAGALSPALAHVRRARPRRSVVLFFV